jgi:hypothetical protein
MGGSTPSVTYLLLDGHRRSKNVTDGGQADLLIVGSQPSGLPTASKR